MEGGRRGRRKRAGPAHFRWPLPDALINAAIAFVSFVTLSVWIPFHFLSEIDLFELVSKGGEEEAGRGGEASPFRRPLKDESGSLPIARPRGIMFNGNTDRQSHRNASGTAPEPHRNRTGTPLERHWKDGWMRFHAISSSFQRVH